MKLWLLDRDPDDVDYDENGGFVVRAETELAARAMAALRRGDEGEACWIDPSRSRCIAIPVFKYLRHVRRVHGIADAGPDQK